MDQHQATGSFDHFEGLWPHQVRAIEQLDTAAQEGSRAPILVLPTGAGKTRIATSIIGRALAQGRRALFLAPRRELVTQASNQLAAVGIGHGVLLAGAKGGGGIYSTVHVASVDTLLARMVRRDRLVIADPDLVVVDEAHLSITETRLELLNRWPGALRIGLTATPTRKDGRALGMLYDRLIEPVTTADLQREGYLVNARYFSVSEPDLKRVRTTAGDYNAADLEDAINRPKLVGDVVQQWLKLAPQRRTVVFATSIAHSVALTEEFLRAGVAAEHVDADTPGDLRDATFERFRTGRTQVLTNCFLASYGFDLPELSCVVLARPTKSLMLYLQMIGRGLRTAPEKTDCMVLDHSGCVHRHGFAHDERSWTLDGMNAIVEPVRSESERKELMRITCPECKCVFTGARQCPECGYLFVSAGKPVATLNGDLVEIGATAANEPDGSADFFAELLAIALERNYKQGWAAHKYKEKFGIWPSRTWNNLIPIKPSEATRRWVKSRAIAWAKSRQSC